VTLKELEQSLFEEFTRYTLGSSARIQRINLIKPAANVLNRSLATMKATQKETANIVQPLIELLLMTVRAALPSSPLAICEVRLGEAIRILETPRAAFFVSI
jgi:hypothetical protein